MPLLPLRKAASYHDVAPATWLLRPWILKGAITELVGTQKDSGKTTLLMRGIVKCILEGAPFLGQAPLKGPVLYLTEQPETLVKNDLEASGLIDHPDLYMLQWHDVWAVDWKGLIGKIRKDAVELGIVLVIVDTISQFALRGEQDENATKDALAIMRPLQLCTANGLSVLIVRHERKQSASTTKAGRGASAWSGAVDIVLRIRRLLNHKAKPNARMLEARGRHADIPEETEIELTSAGYILSGKSKSATDQVQDNVKKALEEGPLSLDDLIKVTGHDRKTLSGALKGLNGALSVEKKGALVRYSLTQKAPAEVC